MKYNWELKDIVAGKIVCKDPSYQKRDFFQANGNSAKWTYKIGFGYWEDGQRPTLNAMTDGMIHSFKNDQELVDYLNKCELIPMPHKWLIETMNYLRDCY
jgi:hypothetical protein